MMTHDEMVVAWMKNPDFKEEYGALEDEFLLLKEMMLARQAMNLSLKQVAENMGKTHSSVARLVAASDRKEFSPNIRSIRDYAEAVGCRLSIKFVPNE